MVDRAELERWAAEWWEGEAAGRLRQSNGRRDLALARHRAVCGSLAGEWGFPCVAVFDVDDEPELLADG